MHVNKKRKYVLIALGLILAIYTLINIPSFCIGETLSTVTFWSTLLFSGFVLKKDLTGMFVASMILGAAIEYLTEAYWDYHLNVYIYRDISLFVIQGWGYSFTFFVLLSNYINRKITRQKRLHLFDKRILLFDTLVGPFWFIANEKIALQLNLWTYSEAAQYKTIIPILDYPVEAFVASILFAMVFPSFVRYWQGEFRITQPIEEDSQYLQQLSF